MPEFQRVAAYTQVHSNKFSTKLLYNWCTSTRTIRLLQGSRKTFAIWISIILRAFYCTSAMIADTVLRSARCVRPAFRATNARTLRGARTVSTLPDNPHIVSLNLRTLSTL
jgi:hypothetical protein